MNFCSNCGSSDLSFIIPEGDSFPRYCCQNCNTIHYQNPRVIVGCIPVWNGKILLGKRAIEPRKGLWNLPAGFMENGETAEDGAAREVFEETKANVKVLRLHTVFSLPQFNQVYLHFLAEMEDGKYAESTSESLEVKLFEPDEIPWDEIAFESSTFALKNYLKDPENISVHIGSYIKELS